MDKLQLTEGDRVILELENECYVGDVHFVHINNLFIELSNVTDRLTNEPIIEILKFQKAEVKNVTILDKPGPEVIPKADNEPRTSNHTSLSSLELNQVENIIRNNIYIFQTDQRYHEAIKYLTGQPQIALRMEGITKGRHSRKPSLLTISSRNQIFIFDIMYMCMPKDLKGLLENEAIVKVVCNSKIICDALEHIYCTKLVNFFDILVGHLSVTTLDVLKNEYDVHEIAAMYLNIPENIKSFHIRFDKRPLNEDQKVQAAINVSFYFKLHDNFVYKIMLKPFLKSCTEYSKSIAQCDLIDSAVKISSNDKKDVKDVKPFELAFD